MKMKHLLLEVYCGYEGMEEQCCCFEKKRTVGIHCFENNCKFMSYTYCPNELAYAGENGVISDDSCFIGFGGEMDIEVDNESYDIKHEKLVKQWENICKNKIADAYEEYMESKKSNKKNY